ncbi:hypothetical protein B9Z55_004604 [Caenorhabditis nigoni]|uniref:Uncharacterized protein n=1 Tax=Caenorhabditis nigoni TaxID=1611254 RepID=A0A2G5UXA7_9PELO|nr:hypothetical protein B9Z55_004604 [Caenorhabditis nigoni]
MRSLCVLILVIFVKFSIEFSDFRLPTNNILCSILQNTKCEWKQNWKNAEGVKRKLDAGPSGVQYFYFCKGERTENCGVWVDEENKQIENYDSNDRLNGDVFVVEKMGIPVLGIYAKFPEEKEDKRLIIE